ETAPMDFVDTSALWYPQHQTETFDGNNTILVPAPMMSFAPPLTGLRPELAYDKVNQRNFDKSELKLNNQAMKPLKYEHVNFSDKLSSTINLNFEVEPTRHLLIFSPPDIESQTLKEFIGVIL